VALFDRLSKMKTLHKCSLRVDRYLKKNNNNNFHPNLQKGVVFNFCSQNFKLFGFPTLSIFSVPDEGYSKNAKELYNLHMRMLRLSRFRNQSCRL
jgi:hypothetical protein